MAQQYFLPKNRLFTTILFLGFLMFGFVTPAVSQTSSKTQQVNEDMPQRGWTEDQTERWMDDMANRPMLEPAAECDEGFTNRRDVVMNGNKITSQITNFGSISSPGNRITDIVWNRLGYGYEFGPFVSAEIVDEGHVDPQSVPQVDDNGDVVVVGGDTVWVMHIVSDGLTSNGGELSPDGSVFWGWQPVPCAEPVGSFGGLQVVEPTSDKIPTSDAQDSDSDGKPDSWPADWYNDVIGDYVWPGALRQGSSNADKEALYFMNDYNNEEFAYYPFNDDDTKRGLGLELEARVYQWVHPTAEDAIFLIYKITNKSDKDLDKVIFGMWGDPHIGGPNNWRDDLADFDANRNMVFAWDDDGRSDVAGRAPGYFGYKFLESPGLGTEIINGVTYPGDGIDNDNDGLIDESWTDGIDNDGDWDPQKHDVGRDGIPDSGDEGEGDGIPTAGDPFDITKPGEPNFEFTDIDESDQIGLTSFASPAFAGNSISNDERVWSLVQPGRFDEVPEDPGDYIFLYGAGDFALRAGETKRFSIALIVGENRDDLILNAEAVQLVYDSGYRYTTPPNKPTLTAVPGDQKVTLFWDDFAEESFDPLSETNDFEGYAIYRSTASDFADQQTITDINGSKYLYQPLVGVDGTKAKWDLINEITGPASIQDPGRGVSYDLGSDTGLRHSFVDSNNVINGQRYFYTVVSYDHGAEDINITPSESAKIITYDALTDTYVFTENTASAIPRTVSAGYTSPQILTAVDGAPGYDHTGVATGSVDIEVIHEMALEEDNPYTLKFEDDGGSLSYSIFDELPVVKSIAVKPGKTSSTAFKNLDPTTFGLTLNGTPLVEGTDYSLSPEFGTFLALEGGAITVADTVVASFTYAAVYQSRLFNGEEANPVFDGMKVSLIDQALAVDDSQTGWISGDLGTSLNITVMQATAGPNKQKQPFDYEIRFSDDNISSAFNTGVALPFEVINLTLGNSVIDVFVPDIVVNGTWDPEQENLYFIETIDGVLRATWEVRFRDPSGAGIVPGAGDVFYLRTTKPFTVNDEYQFVTKAASIDGAAATAGLENIYAVPNPYVASNELEPSHPTSPNFNRGDRRIYFANVPSKCTIRIYTVAGELVDTIEHDSSFDDGKVYWDLRTKDNFSIAYGLYIFHVESDAGTFIGKFAVIK